MRSGLMLAAGLWFIGATMTAAAEQEVRPDKGEELVTVELSTIGLDMQAGAPVVLLREGESGQVVPIWVGPSEAQAIYVRLQGLELPRPMTHDLLTNIIDQLGATVHEVVVEDLRNGTYIGRVRLQRGDGEWIDVDSRPSDAMALALRTDAPIRVKRWIIDQVPPIDFVMPDEMEPVVRTLGVTVVELTDARRAEHNIPAQQQGVLVTRAERSAADRGLRPGDVIESINDQAVRDPVGFFDAVRQAAHAETVRLMVWRGGETFEVQLDLTIPPRPRRDPLIAT